MTVAQVVILSQEDAAMAERAKRAQERQQR